MRKSSKSKFVSFGSACEYFAVSRDHLEGLIADGSLVRGKHYVDVRRKGATRAAYRLHLAELEKWFATPPEKR